MQRWVLAGMALAACDPGPADDDEPRAARAVAHATGTLDGAPRLLYLAAQFAVPAGLDPADPDAFLRDAVTATQGRLAFVLDAIDCDAAIASDDAARITMAVSGCTLLLWTVDIELEAVAAVETAPCDAGTCAVAVRWDVDLAEMASGLRGLPPVRFSGPAELRAPVDPVAPMMWSTQPGFVIETPLGLRFETLTSASWRVDADDCVTVDIGARLSLEERPGEGLDALDERIGDVVVSGRGLRRCPGRCPAAGRVELSFGAGQVLAWEHDGSGTILVQGPRGRELEAELPCAEEQAAGP